MEKSKAIEIVSFVGGADVINMKDIPELIEAMCQCPENSMTELVSSSARLKNKTTSLLLALFLGDIGVHWFYLERADRGGARLLLSLLTIVVAGILYGTSYEYAMNMAEYGAVQTVGAWTFVISAILVSIFGCIGLILHIFDATIMSKETKEFNFGILLEKCADIIERKTL